MAEDNKDMPIRILSTDFPKVIDYVGPKEEPLVEVMQYSDGRIVKERAVVPERSFQLPTYVFWDSSVTKEQQGVIKEAFKEFFDFVGFDKSKLSFFGNWHEEDYMDGNGNLKPFKSVEWQLLSQWNHERKQIDVSKSYENMKKDPYQISNTHWEVVITNRDLFISDPITNFVIGCAFDDLGTIISLSRLETISDVGLRGEAQKTEIFHEFGHVIGLVSQRRGKERIDDRLGPHCKTLGCSMQQGMNVPTDWISITQNRLSRNKGRTFCSECVEDLNQIFKNNLHVSSGI